VYYLQTIVKKKAFIARKDDLMLIEFSVKNFKSIKEKQTLSMVAASGSELRDTNTIQALDNKIDLVRSAAIYGPNASGKTNLIKALEMMRKIVIKPSMLGDPIGVTPYLFSEETQRLPTEFSISIIVQDVRYEYGFITTNEQILEEWLFAYPKGRAQEWISRKLNTNTGEFEWGNMDKLSGQKQVWQEATRPNALFLSTAIQLNNIQLKPIFDWFRLHLRTVPGNLAPVFTFELCEKNDERKQQIIHFLQVADFNINDLEVKSEQLGLQDFLGNILPSNAKSTAQTLSVGLKEKSEFTKFDVKAIHKGEDGNLYELDINDESTGTQKFLTYAGPWLDVLQKGYILVIDELNNNLHPELVKHMVKMFHDKSINQKNAQLILTTHETSILRQDIFRRDQIWFTEKDEFNASILYPLSEFNPRKSVENLEKNYLHGRYGALPYVRDISRSFGGGE
jgi:AAA15 family ATPase/GTPase